MGNNEQNSSETIRRQPYSSSRQELVDEDALRDATGALHSTAFALDEADWEYLKGRRIVPSWTLVGLGAFIPLLIDLADPLWIYGGDIRKFSATEMLEVFYCFGFVVAISP